MSPRVIIGLPIYRRDWIVNHWFEAIERQTFPLEDLGFIFEMGPDDEQTSTMLFDWHSRHPEVSVFDVQVNEKDHHHHHPAKGRSWSFDKYEAMVNFRNNLLARVRCHAPEAYFSLDSDILLEDKDTIQYLFDLIQEDDIDAVAPLMYMTPTGDRFPSVMSWTRGSRAFRDTDNYPIGSLFKADVIMAAKMMAPSTYNRVDYRFHKQGEDLGWSSNCREAGLNLWSASNVYAPHIMSKAMLEEYLKGDHPHKNLYSHKD
jgi:hypothetical protein